MKSSTLVVYLVLFGFATHLEARTWTAADGRTLEAEFVSANATSVTIKRSDGQTFTIPLGKLSKADQDFVGEELKNPQTPRRVTGPGAGSSTVPNPDMTIDATRPWVPAKQNIESEVNKARDAKVEDLMEPVHTVRFGGEDRLIWAPNPDGKTWDVIPFYYNGYGGASTISIMDLGSGEAKAINYERGTNWHLCPRALAPNKKVYISTIHKGTRVGICIYDPATNEMKLDAVAVPDTLRGETHPLIRSPDGMIFAGGGRRDQAAGLIMIDPKDNSVTDFGACGPSHKPSNAYNYYMGADATHVYIASGKVPWYLVAVDRKTKQSTVLAETRPNNGLVSIYQKPHGVTASVRIGDGTPRQDYWCYQGKLIPQKSKPCPWGDQNRPDWEAALPPKPEVYTERVTPPEPSVKAEFWVKADIPKAEKDRDYPGWSCFRYDVPLHAMGSHRLTEMPDGRIIGTAGAYTGNYIFDPATGESKFVGKISLSHYATVVHENKVWMSGYPAAQLYAFDYTKPWNALIQGAGPGTELASVDSPDSNPRLVGRFAKSGCHKIYAAVVGASGSIYGGGRWMRTGNGGGLGWWDPKTEKEDGISDVFSPHAIAFMCPAGGGKYIVISTVRTEDKVLKKPTPKEGKLFIFDDAKKEIIREITVEEGVRGPGPIAWVGGNRVIGWTNDPADEGKSILYGVDVETGEVAWKEPLPFKLPIVIGSNQEEPFDFRLAPDGKIWTFMGEDAKTLVRIDPRTAEVEAVAKVDRGGRLAFSGSDVYLSGTTFLRRIKGGSGG